MAKTYRTQAIILKRINVNEADRLITIFSKDYGKQKLIAKGIRKITSRKKGHLELFTLVKLLVVKGKNLDLITEAETVANFPQLRQNLNRVRIAYLLAELIDKLTAENQEQAAVYQLLVDNLTLLNSQEASPDLILNFEKKLLELLGFGLPQTISRQTLETHIVSITETPLNSKKIR